MKFLKLLAQRMHSYLKDNTLVFCFYFLGSVVAVLMLLYSYGNYMSYKVREAQSDWRLRRYTVELQQTVAPPRGILQALQPYGLESLQLENVPTASAGNGEQPLEQPFLLGTDYINPDAYAEYGRAYFTEEEIAGAKAVVIMNTMGDQRRAKVRIDGVDFQVVGYAGGFDSCQIPYTTFEKLRPPINSVQVVTKERLPSARQNELRDKLAAFFPQGQVTAPDSYYTEEQDTFALDFIQLLCLYLIAVASLLLLAYYMLGRYERENLLLRQSGCTRARLLALAVASNSVTTLLAVLAATALHVALYNPLFSEMNINKQIAYYPADYLAMGLLAVGVTTLALAPFCMRGLGRAVVAPKWEQ